jgi:uncharacterized delta-60 repeat protein
LLEETGFISTLDPTKIYYIVTNQFVGCVSIVNVRPPTFYEFISISSSFVNCTTCLNSSTGTGICPTVTPTPTPSITPSRPQKSFKDCCDEIYFTLTEESELVYTLDPTKTYYVVTDGYTGCTTIVNYPPPVKYNFVSILEYVDCDTCRITEVGTVCPTPTPTNTPTFTVTPTVTPTKTTTPTVTPTVTPTFVNTFCFGMSGCSDGLIYSGCTTSGLSLNSVYQIQLLINSGSINSNYNIGNGFNNFTYGLDVQSDGKILVSGNFNQYKSQSTPSEIVRINVDGSLDNTFNYSGPTYVYTNQVLELNNGQILVGLGQIDGVTGNLLQKVNTDGSLAGGFSPPTFPNGGAISKVIIQPDNRILVSGTFNQPNGTDYHKLVRLDIDGTIDPSFGNGGFLSDINSEKVLNIGLQSDGTVIAVGTFTEYDAIPANKIVGINGLTGNLKPTFVYGSGFNGEVHSIYVFNDDSILLGGNFTSYNGTLSNRIIKLNPNGTVDTSFVVGNGFSDGIVYDITKDSNGDLIIIGTFSQYQNQNHYGIVKLNNIGLNLIVSSLHF